MFAQAACASTARIKYASKAKSNPIRVPFLILKVCGFLDILYVLYKNVLSLDPTVFHRKSNQLLAALNHPIEFFKIYISSQRK